MFAPAIGIDEDPVTGNANGPLGAYLIYYKLVKCRRNDIFTFNAKQGEAMGREGIIHVEVKDGKLEEVSVSGNSIIVFKSEIFLDR